MYQRSRDTRPRSQAGQEPHTDLQSLGLTAPSLERLQLAGVPTVARVQFHGEQGMRDLARSGAIKWTDVRAVEQGLRANNVPWKASRRNSSN